MDINDYVILYSDHPHTVVKISDDSYSYSTYNAAKTAMEELAKVGPEDRIYAIAKIVAGCSPFRTINLNMWGKE